MARRKYEEIPYKSVYGNYTHTLYLKHKIGTEYDKPAEWCGVPAYCYHHIYEAYDRPSEAKVSIWNEWNTVCQGRCYISSRNCNYFTVCGVAKLVNQVTGEIIDKDIYITYAHNYVIDNTEEEEE